MAYTANSYNTPTAGAPQQSGVPKPHSKVLKPDGTVATDWWRFFYALVSPPNQEVGVTVGVSPATYQATANGTLLVKGGTVSAISLTRLNTYVLGITSGLVPMSIGDSVTVTYSVLPTLTWIPR